MGLFQNPNPIPPVFAGGAQPYAPRKLAALSTSVINNPPLNEDSLDNLYEVTVAQWPPEWPGTFQRGGKQPYAQGPLAALATSIINNPQPSIDTLVNLAEIETLWQPEMWPYVFTGRGQPYDRRPMVALTSMVTSNPIPNADAAVATFSAISQWQPDAWPPVFMRGGQQPYAQGPLDALAASVVNNPPLNGDVLANLLAVLQQWRPPDPQPQILVPVSPAIPGRSVDLPPGVHVSVVIPVVDFSLPQQRRFLIPVQVFVQPPPAPGQMSTILQWQPSDQLPQRSRFIIIPGVAPVAVQVHNLPFFATFGKLKSF